MDSLIPFLLVAGPLIGALAIAGIARLRVRLAMVWAAAAVLQTGFWVACASLVTRLPLQATWGAWGAVTGPERLPTWLLIDTPAWSLATVFLTLTAAGVLTALVRLSEYDWKDLVWVFILTGLGVAGCLASSIPAVMVAWGALDLAGVIFLLLHSRPGTSVTPGFYALGLNLLGIAVFGLAVSGWGNGPMDIARIPLENLGIVLAAVGLRGAAAAYRPVNSPRQWGPVIGLLWRMAPSVSALNVLARVAGSGAGERRTLVLSAAAIVGLLAALGWLFDEGGRRKLHLWVGGLFSLAVSAAALESPGAVVALCAALLLCGGLMFIPGTDHPRYRWLLVLAAGAASALPFTPSWGLAQLIESNLWPWGALFGLSYAAFIAGFLAGRAGAEEGELPAVPGVRSIYSGGLILLLVGFILAGLAPMLTAESLPENWWGGGLVVLLGVGWIRLRSLPVVHLQRVFEMHSWEAAAAWIRRLLGRGITAAFLALGLLARLLEGEAAMLWALVLLSLIVSLFVQLGIGT